MRVLLSCVQTSEARLMKQFVNRFDEIDEDGSGLLEFGEFCQLCATFLVEDPDIETMKRELKDAFRQGE